ncbi:MAG: hypothetical protein H7248_10305 [Microbacteriaceae bacterium]|nr:hypothetical protein [Microbacteriaceae bacterium]
MSFMSKFAPRSAPLSSVDEAAQRAGYWPFALARVIPLLLAGLVVTFSADHSASFGLQVFGGFALLNGLTVTVLAYRRLILIGAARAFLIASGVISVLSGGCALMLQRDGVSALFLVLTVWAALTGALELYAGMRCRGRHVASGDLMTVGALTALAAIIFVLIPPEFSQQFVGPDHVKRVLDAAVVAVGLFGAYAIILAVFLTVAGLSMKWGTQSPPRGDVATDECPESTSASDQISSNTALRKGTTP